MKPTLYFLEPRYFEIFDDTFMMFLWCTILVYKRRLYTEWICNMVFYQCFNLYLEHIMTLRDQRIVKYDTDEAICCWKLYSETRKHKENLSATCHVPRGKSGQSSDKASRAYPTQILSIVSEVVSPAYLAMSKDALPHLIISNVRLVPKKR